jgi:hypothetical protein
MLGMKKRVAYIQKRKKKGKEKKEILTSTSLFLCFLSSLPYTGILSSILLCFLTLPLTIFNKPPFTKLYHHHLYTPQPKHYPYSSL